MVAAGIRSRFVTEALSISALAEYGSSRFGIVGDPSPGDTSSTSLEGIFNADLKIGEHGFVGATLRLQKVLSATNYVRDRGTADEYDGVPAPGRKATAAQAGLRGGYDF
jgi:hypothetical protein